MPSCINCGSNETYIDKRGYEHWRHKNSKTYCSRCYLRLFDNPIHSPKWHAINDPKRILFKNKRIILKENPRKGKCKKCGTTIKRTDMHHEKYDDSDPLKHTQELCISCHGKDSANRRWGARRVRAD